MPVSSLSKLAQSLIKALDSPFTITSAVSRLNSLPDTDNPRQLGNDKVPDSRADYFVDDAGDPITIRFPALIDRQLSGVKIGRYFDLFGHVVRFFP